MTISDRIFGLMEKQHISYSDFASLTGIPYSTICNWKSNKSNPTTDKIMTICKVLKVYPEIILGESDPDNATDESFIRHIQEIRMLGFYRVLSSRDKTLFWYYLLMLENFSSNRSSSHPICST